MARDGEGDSYIYEKRERLTAEIKTPGAMDVVYRGVHTMIYDESPVTAAHFTNLPVQVAGKMCIRDRYTFKTHACKSLT